ncbi:MAG: hypothetical protein ABIV51_02280 [Saprospiraceae bacterium]
MLQSHEVPKQDRWRLSAFRVVKYNPKFRNDQGHYMKNEWSDFSDIGSEFDGQILTFEEYLMVENLYVQAVEYLFKANNCTKVQITSRHFFTEDLPRVRDPELIEFYDKLLHKRTVSVYEAMLTTKLVLRGALSCQLQCKNNRHIAVRFSYEYYMYFNTPKPDIIRREIEDRFGLFTR